MSSEAADFQNFLASAAGGGSGASYMGPQDPSLMLPPVNISQVGGDYEPYGPPPPPAVAPYIPPPPAASSSSSSSSSSAPIYPYERYRNYAFSNNYKKDNYGDEYNSNARTDKTYNADLRSTDQYEQEYDVNELNLAGFKNRLKKSKKAGMKRLV
jgi:hypothetical protein